MLSHLYSLLLLLSFYSLLPFLNAHKQISDILLAEILIYEVLNGCLSYIDTVFRFLVWLAEGYSMILPWTPQKYPPFPRLRQSSMDPHILARQVKGGRISMPSQLLWQGLLISAKLHINTPSPRESCLVNILTAFFPFHV